MGNEKMTCDTCKVNDTCIETQQEFGAVTLIHFELSYMHSATSSFSNVSNSHNVFICSCNIELPHVTDGVPNVKFLNVMDPDWELYPHIQMRLGTRIPLTPQPGLGETQLSEPCEGVAIHTHAMVAVVQLTGRLDCDRAASC